MTEPDEPGNDRDRSGEGLDQPGAIVADHGEHERCHDRSLACLGGEGQNPPVGDARR